MPRRSRRRGGGGGRGGGGRTGASFDDGGGGGGVVVVGGDEDDVREPLLDASTADAGLHGLGGADASMRVGVGALGASSLEDAELMYDDIESAANGAAHEEKDAFGDARAVFAMWNAMVGSSVLATPWAFTESGLVLGGVLAVTMALMMAYTSSLVLRYGTRGGHEDLAAMAGARLGSTVGVACNVFMAAMMLQCVVVYCCVLSTSVYGVVKGLADLLRDTTTSKALGAGASAGWAECTNSIHDAFKCWNPFTAIFITAAVLLLLSSFKNVNIFVGLSVLGPFFMTYLICFIVFKSVVAEKPVAPIAPFAVLSSAKKTAGVLASCLFSHHAVIPICRSNAKSKRNSRNVLIAYALTLLSYSLPAIAGNFSAEYVSIRRGENGSYKAANFLRVFPPSDFYTLSAHAAVTLQFVTMVPLLLFIFRTQVVGLSPNVPAKIEWAFNLAVNAFAIAVGCFCAAHPAIDIGLIISKFGALFGFIFAFAIPVLVHLKSRAAASRSWVNHAVHSFILVLGVALAVSQFTP